MEILECSKCLKSMDLCVCNSIHRMDNQHHVLILQHPQEPDQILGSAHLSHLCLKNSTIKVGLSWPNLKVALGKEAQASRWVVLYLGSGIKGKPQTAPLCFVSKKGEPIARPPDLEGIVILDGTWTQAKALWWRNAWLLKLRRAVLLPAQKSLYRELRKEPRNECLSTIESVAETLTALGEPAEISSQLKTTFSALLDKQRNRLKNR